MELLVLIGCGVILFSLIKRLLGSDDNTDELLDRISRLERRVDFLQQTIVDIATRNSSSASKNLTASPENAEITPSSMTDIPLTRQTVSEAVENSNLDTADIVMRDGAAEVAAPSLEPSDEQAGYVMQNITPPGIPEPKENEREAVWVERIRYWLFAGNPMLKVGVVVLFLGLAFLLRFASERFSFPVEARYCGVAAIGVICGIIGWRLRYRYREYGLTLQGASIAILYLTALATLKLHSLLSPVPVFVIQVSLVVLMIFLAVLQDARILAQVALIGGLASPVLISDGSGNHIGLFTYLAVLNTGVAGVAWFKSWRSLNIIGATGTFFIASAWGVSHYRAEYFAVCQAFLIFHTVLYTLIVWRFAQHRAADVRVWPKTADNNAELRTVLAQWWQGLRHIGILDGGLLFGVASGAFILQSGMTHLQQYGVTWSALGFAAFYGLLGYWILRRSAVLKLVAEAMLFLALVFVTLAIGNSSDGWYKTTMWAVEAGLAYWFGLRQASPVSRFFALNLFIGSWLLYSFYLIEPSLNYSLMNSLFIVAAGLLLCAAWHYRRSAESAVWEKRWIDIVSVLTVYLAFMIPYYEYRLESLTNEQSILFASAVVLTCAAVQWRRRNIVLAVFAVIGLFALAVQYRFFHSTPLMFYLAFTAGTVAWCLHKPRWRNENLLLEQQILGFIGLIFAVIVFFGMLMQSELLRGRLNGAAYLIITFTIVILLTLLLRWRQAGIVALGFLPLWGCHLYWGMALSSAVYAEFFFSLCLFVLAALLHGFIMAVQHRHLNGVIRTFWHALGLNLFVFGLTGMTIFWADKHQFGSGWLMTAYMAVSLIALGTIYGCRTVIRRRELTNAYLGAGSFPIWCYLIFWALVGNIRSSALSAPLPYIPLLNPLELTTAAVIYLLWRWRESVPMSINTNYLTMITGAFALFMLSVAAMRIWHHYAGIGWRFEELMRSFGVQATLSVIWAVSAIIMMLKSNKRHARTMWFAGAGLMAVVVLKLFAVELGDSGGIARIVSFIVVGILLLLVGYFAPLPPKENVERLES